jgi:hypothetical protein
VTDFLRDLSNAELEVVVRELETRSEQFSQAVRSQVNDELRRRQMKLIGERRG